MNAATPLGAWGRSAMSLVSAATQRHGTAAYGVPGKSGKNQRERFLMFNMRQAKIIIYLIYGINIIAPFPLFQNGTNLGAGCVLRPAARLVMGVSTNTRVGSSIPNTCLKRNIGAPSYITCEIDGA